MILHVKESFLIAHFSDDKQGSFTPDDAAIDARYAEDADDYDLFDYNLIRVSAELPTEPTDLADEGAAVAEDGTYTPSVFRWGGGDGSVTLSCNEVMAYDGEITARIIFSGHDYVYVKVDDEEYKGSYTTDSSVFNIPVYLDEEMTAREFIVALKEHVEEVNNHIAEGKQMGLTMDEIVMHDCTWGLMPNHYDPDLIAASKDILQEAEKSLPDRPYIWSEYGKRIYAPKMLEYAAKRLEKSGVDIGYYNNQYTTEQGYLLDFFSRLYWREAATRPED